MPSTIRSCLEVGDLSLYLLERLRSNYCIDRAFQVLVPVPAALYYSHCSLTRTVPACLAGVPAFGPSDPSWNGNTPVRSTVGQLCQSVMLHTYARPHTRIHITSTHCNIRRYRSVQRTLRCLPIQSLLSTLPWGPGLLPYNLLGWKRSGRKWQRTSHRHSQRQRALPYTASRRDGSYRPHGIIDSISFKNLEVNAPRAAHFSHDTLTGRSYPTIIEARNVIRRPSQPKL